MIQTFLICIIASTLQCNTLHPDLDQFIPDYDRDPNLKSIAYQPVDQLPPIGKWTNCKNLPEVCDEPSWENNDPSNITVYRFENGTMIMYNFELDEFKK